MPRVVDSPSDAAFVVHDGAVFNRNGSKLPLAGRVIDAAGLQSGAAAFLLQLKSGGTKLKTCHTNGYGVDLHTVSSIDFADCYDRIALSQDGAFALTGDSLCLQLGTVEPDGSGLNVLLKDDNIACCAFAGSAFFTVDGDGEVLKRWESFDDETPSETHTLADFGISSVAAIKGTATEVVLLTHEGDVFLLDTDSMDPCRLGVLPMPDGDQIDLVVSAIGVAVSATSAILLRDGSTLATARPFAGLFRSSVVVVGPDHSITLESFVVPLVGAFLESDGNETSGAELPLATSGQMPASPELPNKHTADEPTGAPEFRFFASPLLQNRTRWLPTLVETACQPALLHHTSSQVQATVSMTDTQLQKIDEEALANTKELEDIRTEVSALRTISESTSIDCVVAYASRCSHVASAETNRSTVDEMVRNSKLA